MDHITSTAHDAASEPNSAFGPISVCNPRATMLVSQVEYKARSPAARATRRNLGLGDTGQAGLADRTLWVRPACTPETLGEPPRTSAKQLEDSRRPSGQHCAAAGRGRESDV
jgi:hypothetical protein